MRSIVSFVHGAAAAILLSGGILMPTAISAEDKEQRLRNLVQSLVSSNKEPPKALPHRKYEFPPGFDEPENKRVIAVIDSLFDEGVAAFPYLIDALDDGRYSYTIVYPRYAHHWDVREVCYNIIQSQVEVFRQFARHLNVELEYPSWLPVPQPRIHHWPEGAKGFMEKWWMPRKSMTLIELQREAVEWAVEMSSAEDSSVRTKNC